VRSREAGETQVRVLTRRETSIRLSGVIRGRAKRTNSSASNWEHHSTGDAVVLLRLVRRRRLIPSARDARVAWKADGLFRRRSGFAGGGSGLLLLDVAAQLPRRLSASCDLEPGSAVKVRRCRPGSAASSIISKVRVSSPTTEWWKRLAPVWCRRTLWSAQRTRNSSLRVESSPMRSVRSGRMGRGQPLLVAARPRRWRRVPSRGTSRAPRGSGT
jgi:hypothetical protein